MQKVVCQCAIKKPHRKGLGLSSDNRKWSLVFHKSQISYYQVSEYQIVLKKQAPLRQLYSEASRLTSFFFVDF